MQFGFQFETCIKTHVNILFNAALIQYTTVKFDFDTGNGKNEFISTNGIFTWKLVGRTEPVANRSS